MDIQMTPVRPAGDLRRATAWATSIAPAPCVFAPWQTASPVGLQGNARTALPNAHWVASYLCDHGADKPLKGRRLDVMLMSPLPAVCIRDDACDAPMPRPVVMQAMLQAAQREGRRRVAIVVDSQRRNPMVRRLLLTGRAASRDEQEIEVLSIEEALCHLVRHAGRWDAIMVMPDLRSLIFAMLAETTGIWSPWPMLWHQRGLRSIASEVLDDSDAVLPLNAPLLVQALALAAADAGLGRVAQRLLQGAARVWDRGIVTQGRGSPAPYVTCVSDDEFIMQLCRDRQGMPRNPMEWRAIATAQPAVRRSARPGLRVVSLDAGQ
ncbi:hypothetical protein [Blastomonas sp. AAP53]|uniref:hypothetical protein n=1 Tax=Blastomonas sp. AAP53 TaxID=1248760 RepID=UPI0012670A15|nr:hypothetical protein [Blastomonas sp. AAP53]